MGRLGRDVAVVVIASVISIPIANAVGTGAFPPPTRSFIAVAVPTLFTLVLFSFCWNRGWSALVPYSRLMALVVAPLYVAFVAAVFVSSAIALMSAGVLYTTGHVCVPDLGTSDVQALVLVAAATPTLAIGLRTLWQSVAGGTTGNDADGAAVGFSVLLALACVTVSAWSLASVALPRLIVNFPPAIVCGP